jgi:hypothetical protein
MQPFDPHTFRFWINQLDCWGVAPPSTYRLELPDDPRQGMQLRWLLAALTGEMPGRVRTSIYLDRVIAICSSIAGGEVAHPMSSLIREYYTHHDAVSRHSLSVPFREIFAPVAAPLTDFQVRVAKDCLFEFGSHVAAGLACRRA